MTMLSSCARPGHQNRSKLHVVIGLFHSRVVCVRRWRGVAKHCRPSGAGFPSCPSAATVFTGQIIHNDVERQQTRVAEMNESATKARLAELLHAVATCREAG
ncbi:hypothetical protein NP493_466g05028 [Ridgeia piscesae]|uniref:Uncharacterized protein n=1 Tax=Ridgeia piscesae TaxID=27915 RepID=A0AAD9KYW6_RIDPI|nr:hypothetical protein NP493_466g05028 [Ridgeia piscesae]